MLFLTIFAGLVFLWETASWGATFYILGKSPRFVMSLSWWDRLALPVSASLLIALWLA